MRYSYQLFFLFLFVAGVTFSADLVRIEPLTDTILCLTFDEGHIDYFSINQDRYNGNKVYYGKLNLAAAMKLDGYLITSEDDAAYSTAQRPVAIGRKAKGVEFHNIYDSTNPPFLLNHWLYLELPNPLKHGATYSVQLEAAENVKSYRFTYDYKSKRSPAVHVNQIGFLPSSAKYAYLSHYMGDFSQSPHQNGALDLSSFAGEPFHVIDAMTHEVVYSAIISLHQSQSNPDFKAASGFTDANMTRADIYQCNFSDFNIPGRYKIAVPRMGCSFPFEIRDDIYREPFYATSRAMFYQRSGIMKEIEPGFNYPRDHHPDDGIRMYYFPSLKGEAGFDIKDALGPIDGVWGWYHDAGDWDGYDTHFRVPLTLLALYDLKPENFGDGDISQTYKESDQGEWIRQGENGIPDILDEAMWLIQYFKRVKERLIALGYSDGGVPGYVGVDAGAEIPSWQDRRDLALKGGEMVETTYRYAAASAWLALCLNKSVNGEHSDSPAWISEAQNAYAWSQKQNRDTEKDVNGAREIAAAALFRVTGQVQYQDDFRRCINRDSDFGNSALWYDVGQWHFAAGIFALTPDYFLGLDAALKQRCVNALVSRADLEFVQTAARHGFRYGVDSNILFMLGVFSTPRLYLTAFAYELTRDRKYLDACTSICDYTLGGNQLDLVKITGVGDNPEPHCFHPDSWFLIDYNSMVYTNPPLPGFVLYEMHRNGDWMSGTMGDIGNGWSWVGDEDLSRSSAYPPIDSFPDAEARFHNRNSIAGSEWTIHQNLCQAIFAYGYLCEPHRQAYTPNSRPTVVLNLQEGLEAPLDGSVTLSAQASPDVERVEYYYQWHFLGESIDRDNQFAFEWKLSNYRLKRGNLTITAKGFDRDGQITRPDEGVSSTMRLIAASSVDEPEGHVPQEFRLGQNYPNPFNPVTRIDYDLPVCSEVDLDIYDLSGRHVASLVDSPHAPGQYTIAWNAADVPSGVYFYRLATESFTHKVKCVLLK